MRKSLATLAAIMIATLGIAACSDADVASRNLSKAADNNRQTCRTCGTASRAARRLAMKKALDQAHHRAFSAVQVIPVRTLQAIRDQLDHLLETGASFGAAKTALQPLVVQQQAVPAESA